MPYSCTIQCNAGFTSKAPYSETRFCRTTGWAPPFNEEFESIACTSMCRLLPDHYQGLLYHWWFFFFSEKSKKYTKLTWSIKFSGECDNTDVDYIAKIKSSLRAKMSQLGMCQSRPYLCDVSNYEIQCGDGGRKKRDAHESFQVLVDLWAEKRWGITQ